MRGLLRALPRPVRTLVEELQGRDLPLSASGLAFYALVSLPPLLIVAMWLTSLLMGDQRIQRFADLLQQSAPQELGAGRAVSAVARQGTTLGVPAILIGLWPASAYGSALVRAFDHVATGKDRRLRGMRGRALLFVVILPSFVVGILGLSFFGTEVLGPGVLSRLGGAALGVVLALVAGTAASALIYAIFPPVRPSWRGILRGAAFSGIGISVLALGFSLALSLGADFKDRYATSAVGGVVLLGVWLFLSNAVLLIGYRLARER